MSSFKFRQVKGKRTYRKWAEWDEGDYIIAKFLKEYTDQFRNPGYEMEIIETDFSSEEANLKEGTIMGLNNNGSLQYRMEDVPEGAVVKITYDGKATLEKGPFEGKECHQVSVAVDESSLDPESIKQVQDESKKEETQSSEEEEEGDDVDL
mgnify:CR=1 FL=1